ncbi:MAG: insulinase family protein [Verrucomicrobia bacterium]|nr:insulinase family protein [Verrucomicrobiota bacterium]
MKSLRFPLLVLALAAAVSSALAASAPALSPRVVAPTDTAQFRRFVLDSGLRVLLVSDPKFNKSGASLVVNVGQIDDPADTEGLAHFLEHMLFLGTEKYPDVAEYGNYMRQNGGYNNAYTSSDITNYQFEVSHAAFAGGLDRFAQFFIAPKFNPEFTGREVNAVHNEAMRHVQNDQRRVFGVARELYAPGSGESKFSTGTKDTLAKATPAVVRAFYEAHYTSDHMALCLAGKAPLDELEKHARSLFSAIPRRNVPAVKREAKFLPRQAALRLAQVEPVKELRQLNLEFVVPATRPDFASKPDTLVTELLGYTGPGGIEDYLKREGLANGVSAFIWERTGDYGSLMVNVSLTPSGQQQHPRVLAAVMSYLAHLRAAPFPAQFFRDRARIGALNETYHDRGEGAALATKLANQALFYPLEVAERAADAWGAPDEAAYRRLLDALTPDNLLVALVAKGVPTDRRERIYNTAYSYREETGAAYDALVQPAKLPFALPGANRFMPGDSPLQAERPLPLISEPGVQLFYAADTEFQRPQTALVFRFVPVRDVGTVDTAALLRLYSACLGDSLDAVAGDAALAGVEFGTDASLEGFKLTVTGFGDSPVRYATHVAEQLRTFALTPQRFDAVKEAVLRTLRSYHETEAYVLARDRRDALTREFHFLPNELIARTESATWADVQAFARKFFAAGKLEAVVHGHLPPDAAIAATRSIAAKIGARPAAESALLRRRHLVIAPQEDIVDAGLIAGVNAAFVRDYLLPDDSPATRAAATVLANFFGEPFYSELRTKQQLGYIVGSSASASQRQRYFTFVVQSSGYAPDELRRRAETFIAGIPALLAAVDDKQWATLIAGARSQLEEKPKSIRDKAEIFFGRAYTYDGEWDRQPASLAALARLTKEQAAALLTKALASDTARRRTVLLHSKSHPPAEVIAPAFTDRDAWKAGRKFE